MVGAEEVAHPDRHFALVVVSKHPLFFSLSRDEGVLTNVRGFSTTSEQERGVPGGSQKLFLLLHACAQWREKLDDVCTACSPTVLCRQNALPSFLPSSSQGIFPSSPMADAVEYALPFYSMYHLCPKNIHFFFFVS